MKLCFFSWNLIIKFNKNLSYSRITKSINYNFHFTLILYLVLVFQFYQFVQILHIHFLYLPLILHKHHLQINLQQNTINICYLIPYLKIRLLYLVLMQIMVLLTFIKLMEFLINHKKQEKILRN